MLLSTHTCSALQLPNFLSPFPHQPKDTTKHSYFFVTTNVPALPLLSTAVPALTVSLEEKSLSAGGASSQPPAQKFPLSFGSSPIFLLTWYRTSLALTSFAWWKWRQLICDTAVIYLTSNTGVTCPDIFQRQQKTRFVLFCPHMQ